ncbi:hypothetical protein EDF70_12032 [Neorhizobium sp. JUb45]|nr:hypothetical protein EDF70_12032 [Neorhizobium sp. JUb45]
MTSTNALKDLLKLVRSLRSPRPNSTEGLRERRLKVQDTVRKLRQAFQCQDVGSDDGNGQ